MVDNAAIWAATLRDLNAVGNQIGYQQPIQPRPGNFYQNAGAFGARIARAIARSARIDQFNAQNVVELGHDLYRGARNLGTAGKAGAGIIAASVLGKHALSGGSQQPAKKNMQVDGPMARRQPYYGGGQIYGPRAKKLMKSKSGKRMYGKVQTRFAYPTGLNKKFSDVLVSKVLGSTAECITTPLAEPYIFTSFFKQILLGTSGDSARIGRRIVCHSVQIQMQLSSATFTLDCADANAVTTAMSSNNFDTYVNIAVVRNMQTNGTAASFVDIWDSTSMSNNVPLRNMANTMQFQVLKHKKIKVTPEYEIVSTDGTTTQVCYKGLVKYVDFYWKCAELINYSGSGDDIANIVDNNVCLMAWTDNRDSDASGQYQSAISAVTQLRVRYTDLQ